MYACTVCLHICITLSVLNIYVLMYVCKCIMHLFMFVCVYACVCIYVYIAVGTEDHYHSNGMQELID